MSDDFRRRRRLSNTGSPRRSAGPNGINPWVITIFAAVVVIAGGWFLGQALARVFNGSPKTQVAQAPTPLPVVTPIASPSPGATAAPSTAPSATPRTTPTPKPTPEPSPTATVPATQAPIATPQPTSPPTATPPPVPKVTPAPVEHTIAPKAAATPQPEAESPATRVVRAYIDALRRGDPSSASSYLGNGVPDESFIDAQTRISSISSSRNGDGSYKVSVDMQTAKGEYYETFTVASDRILDKTAIKP